MNEFNPIIIGIIAIFTFLIGFMIAHKRLTKRVGGLKKIEQQYNEWKDKLDTLHNEVWKISQDVVKHRQEATKSISEFKQKKTQATTAIAKMNATIKHRKQSLAQLEEKTKDLQKMEANRHTIEKAYTQIEEKKQTVNELQKKHDELKSELSLYSNMDSFVEYSFYPLPAYGEASSGAYNEKLKSIRQVQKTMLKESTAYTSPQNIEITGNTTHDNRLMKNQGYLIIKAFNSECDYLISKVNSKNYEATLTKIEKLAEQLEKRLVSLEIGISLDYVELKMQECTVYYQYICQKQAEAEEQREIRAQIREETTAQREIEKALKDAEREEHIIQKAMEKARREIANGNAEQKEKYELQLQNLMNQLTEAETRGQRALSMAQQTKQGYVYVISNIGSFGEDIYKIGMTRRLEPLDRVKELGDASVPFIFDVHAMIHSDDAPALEKELHSYFYLASVNKVNKRKEFFDVSLKDIREYVESRDLDTHWTMAAEATEYRQSLVIAEQQGKQAA